MPAASRLSADGQWWGVRGYWRCAVSPDGFLHWDGSTVSAIGRSQSPECLETLDHRSLEANRQGRITAWQVGRLAPRFLFGWFYAAVVIPLVGSAFDIAGCLIGLVISVVVTIMAVPVTALLFLLEWVLGSAWEEGPLLRIYDRRRRFVSVGGTRVAATWMNIDRMMDGAPHRLYFTRVFHRLVNYERLGGNALTRFANRAVQERRATRRAPKTNEVSVWASGLKAGRLPPVCFKSGRSTESRLMFWFVTRRGLSFWVGGLLAPGRRAKGRLPLTKGWRITFIVFRAVAIGAAGVGVVGLFAVGAVPAIWRATVAGIAFAAIATFLATYFLYSGLLPKAEVLADAKGETFVVLRNVHPAFVQAVKAMYLSDA